MRPALRNRIHLRNTPSISDPDSVRVAVTIDPPKYGVEAYRPELQ